MDRVLRGPNRPKTLPIEAFWPIWPVASESQKEIPVYCRITRHQSVVGLRQAGTEPNGVQSQLGWQRRRLAPMGRAGKTKGITGGLLRYRRDHREQARRAPVGQESVLRAAQSPCRVVERARSGTIPGCHEPTGSPSGCQLDAGLPAKLKIACLESQKRKFRIKFFAIV